MVEDDDRLRQLISQNLEAREYWVFFAQNAEDAWVLFNEHWPLIDLLMTEVVLPGMDDLELTTRVRELCPDLQVLYMVGEDQLSNTGRQGVTDTRNAYLMKPFDYDYLLLKVQAGLKG